MVLFKTNAVQLGNMSLIRMDFFLNFNASTDYPYFSHIYAVYHANNIFYDGSL